MPSAQAPSTDSVVEMGRRARREQARAEKKGQNRRTPPRGVPAQTSAGTSRAVNEAASTGAWWKPRWIADIFSELKRVTWPSRGEIANLTGVVIVISIILGLLLGGFDLLFSWVVEQVLF